MNDICLQVKVSRVQKNLLADEQPVKLNDMNRYRPITGRRVYTPVNHTFVRCRCMLLDRLRDRTATLASGSNQPPLVCHPVVCSATWVHARRGPARPSSVTVLALLYLRRQDIASPVCRLAVSSRRPLLGVRQRTDADVGLSCLSCPRRSAKTHSLTAARNRLWVVAPSMLTGHQQEPMRQQQ